MEKTYNPQDIEQPLYEHWEKQGYFKPNGDESQESFCIMIPPPNVTGSLHMGHAFQQTIMAVSYTHLDVYKRQFQNQLFADILAGIESVTSEHNYQTLIANYNYDRDSEEESVINLLSYNIDGIILSEKYHTIRTVKFLRSATIPVVELMDVQGERLDMEVGFDNRQAAFDMVCTMLEKRVRHKILYLGSKDDTRDEQRYQGYCDAMMLHNLSPLRMNPRAISSIHLGMQLMRDALSANPDLDGVFCTNDDIAMGALLLCRERNLAVPEQISIAGFHGLEIGRQMIPSLASVITPRFDIGRMSAQMLLSKIKNNDPTSLPFSSIVLLKSSYL